MSLSKTLSILLLASLISPAVGLGLPSLFAGATFPMGNVGDLWSPGWAAGIDVPIKGLKIGSDQFEYHVGLSVQRFTPNTDALLDVGDRHMRVESERGWAMICAVAFGCDRSFWKNAKQTINAHWSAELSSNYCYNRDIYISGAYITPDIALTRVRTISSERSWRVGFSAGVGVRINDSIDHTIKYQYLVGNGSGRSYIVAGLELYYKE